MQRHRLFMIAGVVCLLVGLAPLSSLVGSAKLEEPTPTLAEEAGGRIRVGEVETTDLKIDYASKQSWTHTIRYPSAAYIKVHFLKLDLLLGDYVTVSDPAGIEVYTYPEFSDYTTDGEEGFWAISVTGDTAIIELHSEYEDKALAEAAAHQLGVVIDKYARGYPPEEILSRIEESTCGTNQRTDVVCYQSSHPTEYSNADAVARLLIDAIWLCTGWRVGPSNHMFTNEHCITDQTDVQSTEAWFNYQRLVCGSGGTGTVTKVTGNTLLVDDYTLDFALFTVNNFSSISGFGYLELDVRTPVLGEEIYIPQHGAGNPKQFGIESDMNTGNVCRIDDAVADGRGTNTDTGYYCDTTGGSSGSPVLARSSHEVIGLHHFGIIGTTCTPSNMNQGVRVDLIWPLVEPYLGDGGDQAQWTFLVYLDGDNNLEGAGIDDFLEMSSVGSTSDVNVVVQFDRIPGYDSSHGNWTSTKRFLVTPGMTPTAANQLQDIGEANMGDPQTLIDFVQWGMSNYPADHYAVVLWDHGSGWRLRPEEMPLLKDVAYDATSGDAIDMPELRSAMSTLSNDGVDPLDLVGFDACLMGMIEVDNQLIPYVDVRVGSEETEPWDGWPYDPILSALTGTPSMPAGDLATAIVDEYYASYGNDETQSALDLHTAYSDLNTAVNDFAVALINGVGSHHSEMQTARSNSQQFYYPTYIDLYDFAYQINVEVTDATINAAATDVMNAVNNAVTREQHGAGWPGAHGISIYFPKKEGPYDDRYDGNQGWLQFTADTQWDEWLHAFYSGAGNLLSNASFEEDGQIPAPWRGRNLTVNDRRVCKTAHDGSCSFRMVGTSAQKLLMQVVNISGSAGDSFTLRGWSRAKNPSPTGGAYCLLARVFHTDATRKGYRTCFARSTHGWQYRERTFTIAKDYNKIIVFLIYARQSGAAWFDDVRLVPH